MQQFYENLQAASRKEVIRLFESSKDYQFREGDKSHFVPFNQERDKLGRLISREGQDNAYGLTRKSLPARKHEKPLTNPESRPSERVRQSNITVEKLFKLHDIKGSKKQASLSKLRILSTVSREKMLTPTVGQYDTAIIADKVKYQKPKITAIPHPQSHLPLKKQHSVDIIKSHKKSMISRHDQGNTSTQKLKQYKKVEISYDLPELQMYHEMKKLKMRHYDNFEESHLKFKELARHGLVLANQIKKRLELD